jgi:hypothetical protein
MVAAMRWLCVAILGIACGGGRPEPEPPVVMVDDDPEPAVEEAQGSGSACEPYVSPWRISSETCAERAELLRTLFDAQTWSQPVLAGAPELPVVERWNELPAADGRLQGTVINLSSGDGAGGPRPPLPIEEARAAPEPYVIVVAGPSVAMVDVADLAEALPGKELRLAVRKPAAAVLELHVERYPWTPTWVTQLVGACEDLSLTTIGPALEQAGTGCAGTRRVLDQLATGAGIDVLGPLAAAALLECECSARDTDGFTSLLIFATSPMPDVGWIPLPRPVPRTGRVGEWARAR